MAWDDLAKGFRKTPSHLIRLLGEEFLACHLSDQKLRALGMTEYIGVGHRGLLVQALEQARRRVYPEVGRAAQIKKEGLKRPPKRAGAKRKWAS